MAGVSLTVKSVFPEKLQCALGYFPFLGASEDTPDPKPAWAQEVFGTRVHFTVGLQGGAGSAGRDGPSRQPRQALATPAETRPRSVSSLPAAAPNSHLPCDTWQRKRNTPEHPEILAELGLILGRKRQVTAWLSRQTYHSARAGHHPPLLPRLRGTLGLAECSPWQRKETEAQRGGSGSPRRRLPPVRV